MSCDTIREALLDFGWDESDRRRASEVLGHLNACEACASAARDFDRLRAGLTPGATEVEPHGGWAAFEARLENRPGLARRRLRFLGGALAASLLLAVGGWGMYLRQASFQPHPDGKPAWMAAVTPREVAERLKVFDEVATLFDGQLGWVLVGEKVSDLGLAPPLTDTPSGLLLLRLTVSRGDRIVSVADLVIRAGQAASLTAPSESRAGLRYQIATSARDPTRLQVSVEFEQPDQREGAQEVAAGIVTDLRLKPGRMTSAGQVVSASGRYELNIGLYKVSPGV